MFAIMLAVLLGCAFIGLLISWHSHRTERLERESLRRHVRTLTNAGCGF